MRKPTPRREVIYLALTMVRSKELYEELAGDKLLPGERNRRIGELADIVDAALQEEVERRRKPVDRS